MGVDYTASLVYGVPIKMKRIPVQVTRYHEVTGEPYEKTIYKYKHVVGDNIVVFSQNNISDVLYKKLRDDQKVILEDQNGYFGIRLASVDPAYGESETITADAVTDAKQAFKQLVTDTFPDHPVLQDELLSNGQLILTGLAW